MSENKLTTPPALLPCPFECGGPVDQRPEAGDFLNVFHSSENCPARGWTTAERWNRRAPSPAVREALERIRDAAPTHSVQYLQNIARGALSGSAPAAAPCPECKGRGGIEGYRWDEYVSHKCPTCDGTGRIHSTPATPTYDDAVRALAPFLPLWVKWVAIHDQAHVQGIVLFDKKPEISEIGPWWNAARRARITEVAPLCLPLIDWRLSLRRVEAGRTVTP